MRGRKLLSRCKHDVYRVYDCQGRLLYVGSSVDAFTRLNQHKKEHQPWYPLAHEFEVIRYADGWTARYFEAVAIRDESPIWNVRRETTALVWANRIKPDPVEPGEVFQIH
ncbi:GIY-YIG nuclease family protein [Pseudarthrobacter phenanthrenivorans]|uniref:GIY-YIG nuclease family protein n=1 Tax=Pseudarthrobacter phenanthrenivorans TaxID=361575 RepID=UPI00344EEF9F